MKFKAIFDKHILERKNIVDETNFFSNFFIGFDGNVYENYGTNENPLWEVVFDASVDLIIEDD